VLHDREAETGATSLSRSGLIDSIEPLEDPLLLFLGDPDALVGHGDLDDIYAAMYADRNPRSLAAVGDSVVEQVADRGSELGLIAIHDKVGVTTARNGDSLDLRGQPSAVDRLVDDSVDQHLVGRGQRLTTLQP
jgi:hypothetical protein